MIKSGIPAIRPNRRNAEKAGIKVRVLAPNRPLAEASETLEGGSHMSLISLSAFAFSLFNDALKFDPASGLESYIFIEIPLGFRIFV